MQLHHLLVFIVLTTAFPHEPTGMCRNDPPPGFNKTNFYLNRQPLLNPSAKCNDGSQAQLYFRPCCSGPDYGDFCNVSTATWFVVFGDGDQDGWCWDADSCARRAALRPSLTSSDSLPDYFGHFDPIANRTDMSGIGIGAFAKSGEGNPNFYKAYAAYVPYCSSDLFLGECSDSDVPGTNPVFCGKSIVKAAMTQLVMEMEKYVVDDVVLVGGAGIMSYIAELRDMLPSGARTTAICDGCVLFDDLPAHKEPALCLDAYSCTPDRTLPAGVALWGAELSSSCGGWRCLLSTRSQGNHTLVARAAVSLPLLAQQPLYASTAFSARGISPGVDRWFDVNVRLRIEGGLKAADIVVASACTTPVASFTRDAFFHRPAGDGSYPRALYSLVRQKGKQLVYVDSCNKVDCNLSCTSSKPSFKERN